MKISNRILELADEVTPLIAGRLSEIDAVALENTARVLDAYRALRVSDGCFAGSTGYGYDDLGRETLDGAFASVFGAEAALTRLGFVNGTHAIATALFACLESGDTLLAATGAPYDTLLGVIGVTGGFHGSLRHYGVRYAQTELAPDGGAALDAIRAAVLKTSPRAVLVQRSRGYGQRRALSVSEIGDIASAVHESKPDCAVVVDNCYGEFTETAEPTALGADLIAGSLIKNPGGGLAPSGGYVAGRRSLVENAAARLTCPGIGGECGATLGQNRLLYQGFFMAPHVVAQALKTAVFCAALLEALGFRTSPSALEKRSDLIQAVELGSAEALTRFCRGIQHGSPVDSFASPEPARMPGYESEVVMAAGTFIQGSSIELSCDGPLREPFTAYLQGGLSYEAGRLGVMSACSEMLEA